MNQLTVSGSPHVYGDETIKKIMYGVVIAMIPALLVSVYYFGLGAIRVTLMSVVACLAVEYLIQKFIIKGENTINDGSALITGLLLAFNVPSNLPWHIILIGAVVSIGIGKMSFGGLGKNIFNPALVGRVFLLISFPVQMTSWPEPSILSFSLDAVTGATPLAILKENGPFEYVIQDLLIGNLGGSLGEVSAIALLIGGIYMLVRKIITWHIPVSFLATVIIFSGIFWLIDQETYMDPLFHLATGGIMLGVFFMATDMVTSPMTPKAMLIFGFGVGLITMLIRMFGAYPEGVSFAILIMNAVVPLLNNAFKPKRFGETIKAVKS